LKSLLRRVKKPYPRRYAKVGATINAGVSHRTHGDGGTPEWKLMQEDVCLCYPRRQETLFHNTEAGKKKERAKSQNIVENEIVSNNECRLKSGGGDVGVYPHGENYRTGTNGGVRYEANRR
jgi:hypothetical protein